jgi:hypothetical protein
VTPWSWATACFNYAVSCPQALFFWHAGSITKVHICRADNEFVYIYLQVFDFLNSKHTVQNPNSRTGFTPKIHPPPHNSITGYSPENLTSALDSFRENLRWQSKDLLWIKTWGGAMITSSRYFGSKNKITVSQRLRAESRIVLM